MVNAFVQKDMILTMEFAKLQIKCHALKQFQICESVSACSKCSTDFSLINGQCKKTSCNSITNCDVCFEEQDNQIYCTQCSSGYQLTYDGKSWVVLAEQDCNRTITGCLK